VNKIDSWLYDAKATWIDFSDKSTWFCDPECKIPAYRMQDVNYVACKLWGAEGAMFVDGKLEADKEGRVYIEVSLDESP